MKKKNTIILTSIIVGVLVVTLGLTYAALTFNETKGNSQLVLGDIYMHYGETNQLVLNDAMPIKGIKTLTTGYPLNEVMTTQDATDVSTELYACINLFENEWGWPLLEGEDFESFCKGTGTNFGHTFQYYLYDFDDEQLQEMLSLNIIKEESIEYTNVKLNPELQTQSAEYENELTACVNFFQHMIIDEGSTVITYCKGTGTSLGRTFQENLNIGAYFVGIQFEYLSSNNIIIKDGESYIVNPIMATQEVGETNELMSCVAFYAAMGFVFDEGTTAETFCKGTGTYDGSITLKSEFENGSNDRYYMLGIGKYLLKNNIILAEIDLPYFEFTIDGKNTYTREDIWYEIVLNHGDNHDERTTRIRDDLLKFRLVEVVDENETVLLNNKSYSDLSNKRIHVDTIPANTNEEINRTYRLYMWISEDTVIGNADEDYTFDEWNDVYASIKVNVTGDFNEKELAYEDMYNVTDASCFETEEVIIYEHNSNITDEEVSLCIDHLTTTWGPEEEGATVDVGETYEAFCKGIGTNWGETLTHAVNDWIEDETLMYFEENNIIIGTEGLSIMNYDESCVSDVVIPKTINNLPILKIGEDAFCSNLLTSVVLPDSIKIIDRQAFWWNQLTSIEIPDSVIGIHYGAFMNNVIKTITLGKNVKYIETNAFPFVFGYGVEFNPVTHVINKSGMAFDWSDIFSLDSRDGNNEFETGEFKYYDSYYGEKVILITSE